MDEKRTTLGVVCYGVNIACIQFSIREENSFLDLFQDIILDVMHPTEISLYVWGSWWWWGAAFFPIGRDMSPFWGYLFPSEVFCCYLVELFLCDCVAPASPQCSNKYSLRQGIIYLGIMHFVDTAPNLSPYITKIIKCNVFLKKIIYF